MRRILVSLAMVVAAAWSSAVGVAGQVAPMGTRHTLDSKVLGEERVYFVHLPASYELGRLAYPLLYITDGERQFAHTAATVDFLAREGRIPEMIVVGVGNTDRTRDLTPTRADLEGPGGQIFRAPTSGGADPFLAFFERELFPAVEESLRVQPYRVFAGHSFGGLFALHALTRHGDLFDAYLATSPTLIWDQDLPLRRIDEALDAGSLAGKALYVSLGEEGPELDDALARLRARLERDESGLRWKTEVFPGEDHGSVLLRSQYHGLRSLFDDWWFPQDLATGRFTGGLDDLRQHYGRLSERMGYDVLPPELLVNRLGYQFLQGGEVAEAVRVFELNVELYPESANVHDSLGEALEARGDLAGALRHYGHAVAKGERDGHPALRIFRQNRDRVRDALDA